MTTMFRRARWHNPLGTCSKAKPLSTGMPFQILRDASLGNDDYSDAFQYTSGRWLFNESTRLQERHLEFDIPALLRAAAVSIGRNKGDVVSICKLAEGGFNRTFEITMNDGFKLIARLPYPSTQPKRLAVASEVATMDLVRSSGIPVPEIYGSSPDAKNPVGAEYILMEKAPGRSLGNVWFTMSEKERIKILAQIAKYEARLFEIDFPAYGSIYYDECLPASMGKTTIRSTESKKPICIGPDVSLKMWFEERSALNFRRGPCKTSEEVLRNVAEKEIAWLQTYGRPRLPFDRVYREITNYQQSDPEEHVRNLERYIQIALQLVPTEKWLQRPTLRHPDLNPNNIFISEDFEIVSIIDWQHSNILPLFLQAAIPAHFQNYGDPESEELRQPQLPQDIDEMEEEDRNKDLELYRRRHLHFYYIGATAKNNNQHFEALMHDGGLLRRKIFQHAGEPWEGNNIPLKGDLIQVAQDWPATTISRAGDDGNPSPCPISFTDSEIETTMQAVMKQEEADSQMEILRNAIGINVDGWTSHEGYEQAVLGAAEMKRQAVGYADSEFEREMTLRHWPFEDHDEKE